MTIDRPHGLELVDLEALAGWMGDQGLGAGPITEVVQLTGGSQNVLLRFWPAVVSETPFGEVISNKLLEVEVLIGSPGLFWAAAGPEFGVLLGSSWRLGLSLSSWWALLGLLGRSWPQGRSKGRFRRSHRRFSKDASNEALDYGGLGWPFVRRLGLSLASSWPLGALLAARSVQGSILDGPKHRV